jgi:hypothetical protein
MTTLKDPIRQASLFTSFGLIDPRLMPGYTETTTKPAIRSSAKQKVSLREVVENLFRKKLGFQ